MSVRPEQVIALSQQIRGGANGIKSQLETLESEVGKLRSSWNGEAQNAYDDAQRKWNQSLIALNTLLEQIAAKTEEISQGYVSTDRSAAGRFAL
ncbi:WXG100 family type VII secretion target [Microbacterium sp. BG28]|uniref:WXG100 family type VII secretion target n=1 Tax=Microbacterium sp. BG28 TaxID=3097356 RepID=UPI002A5ADDED|nr:WXG100 family type VII secretion target [Microbacterium sp. BG28]MDY0829889.1 WXG100 family type VII secretion target [Microbacterium sp. BG28]